MEDLSLVGDEPDFAKLGGLDRPDNSRQPTIAWVLPFSYFSCSHAARSRHWKIRGKIAMARCRDCGKDTMSTQITLGLKIVTSEMLPEVNAIS